MWDDSFSLHLLFHSEWFILLDFRLVMFNPLANAATWIISTDLNIPIVIMR
jgi:hypothetical protein